MSKYKGLFTFDEDNHRYVPIAQADGIIDTMDYKPAEPLIKDEKIRKAVRAWAEANNLNNVAFEDYDDENCYFIDGDYEPQIWFSKKSILESPLDDGKIYTIAELCGEEEE